MIFTRRNRNNTNNYNCGKGLNLTNYLELVKQVFTPHSNFFNKVYPQLNDSVPLLKGRTSCYLKTQRINKNWCNARQRAVFHSKLLFYYKLTEL